MSRRTPPLAPAGVIAILVVAALAGCERLNPGSEVAELAIRPELRRELVALDKRVVTAYRKRDTTGVIGMLSDHFLSLTSPADLLEHLGQYGADLADTRVKLVTERYLRTAQPNQRLAVDVGDATLTFDARRRTNYLLCTELTEPDRTSYYLCNAYSYDVGGAERWELDFTIVDLHGINGHPLPELVATGQRLHEAGAVVPAWAYAAFLREIYGEDTYYLLSFGLEEAVDSLYAQALRTPDPLPDTVAALPGAPVVTAVYLERMAEGLLPVVEYVTGVDFADTLATRRESEQLARLLPTRYRGFGELPAGCVYEVLRDYPAAGDSTDYRRYLHGGEGKGPGATAASSPTDRRAAG